MAVMRVSLAIVYVSIVLSAIAEGAPTNGVQFLGKIEDPTASDEERILRNLFRSSDEVDKTGLHEEYNYKDETASSITVVMYEDGKDEINGEVVGLQEIPSDQELIPTPSILLDILDNGKTGERCEGLLCSTTEDFTAETASEQHSSIKITEKDYLDDPIALIGSSTELPEIPNAVVIEILNNSEDEKDISTGTIKAEEFEKNGFVLQIETQKIDSIQDGGDQRSVLIENPQLKDLNTLTELLPPPYLITKPINGNRYIYQLRYPLQASFGIPYNQFYQDNNMEEYFRALNPKTVYGPPAAVDLKMIAAEVKEMTVALEDSKASVIVPKDPDNGSNNAAPNIFMFFTRIPTFQP